MKHKNLSWAQRERNGQCRLQRLLMASKASPKDNSLRRAIAITQSEIRQRKASTRIKAALEQAA